MGNRWNVNVRLILPTAIQSNRMGTNQRKKQLSSFAVVDVSDGFSNVSSLCRVLEIGGELDPASREKKLACAACDRQHTKWQIQVEIAMDGDGATVAVGATLVVDYGVVKVESGGGVGVVVHSDDNALHSGDYGRGRIRSLGRIFVGHVYAAEDSMAGHGRHHGKESHVAVLLDVGVDFLVPGFQLRKGGGAGNQRA
eukprot:TRINITY_DN2113_c0_g3_i1.p1 TRINITY_DN2113_c0_g3~~TRINITY_DN2113_c0_g3_i1.p1  ORF type:complete len:197 (-),score=5.21 TRINITY_DN2113_c0_g3_i1:259-849(-)